MGSQDLECIATGLAIVGDDDARCVFFFLVGDADRAAPISLPIRGTWSGMCPRLDAGWHETALLGGLRRLDARQPRTAPSAADPLYTVVASTFGGARALVTTAGQPIIFCAALEAFYDTLASSGGGPGGPRPAGSTLELAREAIGRDDLALLVYADAPEPWVTEECVAFRAFRRWLEPSRSFRAAFGRQFDRDDITERMRRAAEQFTTEAEPRRALLAAALAVYESEHPDDDEDEDDDDAAETAALANLVADQEKLVDHIGETLRKRPDIDAAALASSIEVFRMIQAVPVTVLPAVANVETNKLRWRKAIERVGTTDVTALVEALRAARSSG